MIPGVLYAVAFVWAWVRRSTWGRHVIFGLGFFVINLAPILGLMKIAYLRLTLVADHFQYTAMISVIALTVAGLAQLLRMEPKFKPVVYYSHAWDSSPCSSCSHMAARELCSRIRKKSGRTI